MRRPISPAIVIAFACSSSSAAALVTEPNGEVVPRDSQNGETQLYTLFQSRGEPIDWQADGLATPNAFSPLCGFTATLVLRQTACSQALAWYNETGTPPPDGELYEIVPAGAPIGQTFTGADIKSDPHYKGGLVGFAIRGNGGCSQNHHSNPAYNESYNGSPWILAVIYASKVTSNAFYVTFEDGSATSGGWSNDGDFNDDVFFVTGVTCSGGGQPCDTGQPGICASGVTQCVPGGTTCQALVSDAPEKCNGLDDDCNGQLDEGDICDPGYVCDKGTCVQNCQGGEFSCPVDKVCSSSGHCVEPACKDVTCDAGKVCHGGACTGPCDGVVCPYPTVCRVGVCLDPCAGVTCDTGQVCDQGVCVTRCDCLPCTGGEACDVSNGLCVEPSCVGIDCGPGSHCVAGACVDVCLDAVCPVGQACKNGQCVDKPAGTGGTGGGGGGTGGTHFGDGGGGSGAGGAGTGGTGTASHGTGGSSSGSKGSCGCETASGGGMGLWGWAGVVAAAVLAARRRR